MKQGHEDNMKHERCSQFVPWIGRMSKKLVIDMLESFFNVLVFIYLNELVTHSMLVTFESKIIFK